MDTTQRPADILRHGQVELRRWRPFHIGPLDRLITESRDHLLPTMPFVAGHDRRQGEAFLAWCEEQWAAGHAYLYAIRCDGETVGSCALMRTAAPGGLDIGYWLHRSWTGRGLATMAAAALVDAGRRLPYVERIEIHHDQANHASGAVARRLGFTEVARVLVPWGQETPGSTGVDVYWRLIA
ncbi:GNAT family N-acetyltransferase [Streptomyces sp. NPDC001941]|uniref:GNAT family N-acetyltransferase n=1 Tax=Streptomyces sp. NPDC001941 TaxID=3154659 RepID=UPI003320C1CD